MCDFKPGDEVVCVDAAPANCPGFRNDKAQVNIVVGLIYTVESVFISNTRLGITLTAPETKWTMRQGGDGGYNAARFRKVQRRDISQWLETETDYEEPKRKKATA